MQVTQKRYSPPEAEIFRLEQTTKLLSTLSHGTAEVEEMEDSGEWN